MIGIVVSFCVAAAFGQPAACSTGYLPASYPDAATCALHLPAEVAAYEWRIVTGAKLMDRGRCVELPPGSDG